MTNKIPDPEVKPKPRRRKFNAAYKLKVLTQADKCSDSGQISALLRREGLYSSHLCDWRKQRDEGTLAALSKRKGRPLKINAAEKAKIQQLEKQVQSLQEQLRKAELIIDVQKKLSRLLNPEENQGKPS